VDQGQQRASWTVRAGLLAQFDQRIGGLLDALGQGGSQQQAGVGDGVGIVRAMSSWSRVCRASAKCGLVWLVMVG
jgi:hypothetical protein